MMTTLVNTIEFKTVVISGMDCHLNIIKYCKENYSLYFSLQSVAQCINEFLNVYSAHEIFHKEFYDKWSSLNLSCMTEFEIQILVPINLIIEPAQEIYNPMPSQLSNIRYLNDKYLNAITEYSNHTSILNDIFCIAEKQNFTITQTYNHKFINSIGFLSLIPILKLPFLRRLYTTFFDIEMINSDDIEYIYETLLLNRQQQQQGNVVIDEISNVFQLQQDEIKFTPLDITDSDKELFVTRFNRACRVLKSFAFNIINEQSVYISKNLQIMTQFGMDRRTVESEFRKIPKLTIEPSSQSHMTYEQNKLLCKEQEETKTLPTIELQILHSIIKIHLMITRMTGVHIDKDDLKFYKHLLNSKFSIDLNELIFDMNMTNGSGGGDNSEDICNGSYNTTDNKVALGRNYTIGEIINEFIQLNTIAQKNVNTLWLTKFIAMACNPNYSNIVNIMADFIPYFQRFFTNDFNINSINNMIIFLQGMCRPDYQKIKTVRDFKEINQMNVNNFKSFSITQYKSYNSNPLYTLLNLILYNKQQQQQQNTNYIINLNQLSETEHYNILSLIDPNEKDFIDYVYNLEQQQNTDHNHHNNHHDMSGERRFNYQQLDYDTIVPLVSTNTFNENNTTTNSSKNFTSIMEHTLFFHELTNRIVFKVPGVVANIILK